MGLTGLGCEVSLIDANALASIDAGAREPDWTAEGWDAADALVDWSDVETLRRVALGLAKPYEAAKVAAVEPTSTRDEVTLGAKLRAATTIAEIKSVATILKKDDIGGPSISSKRALSPRRAGSRPTK
jgi:hypothetical protein